MSLSESLRNESFDKIRPTLGDRQWEVFSLVAYHSSGLSAWEVASKLNRPVYVVRPRLTELRKLGLLSVSGLKYHPETDRRESIWSATPTVHFDTSGQGEFL